MNRQLAALVVDLEAAHDRLRRLVAEASEADWARRPAAGGWSAGECVGHLNLTSRAFVPLLREGLARARSVGGAQPARLRRDLMGWLLWKSTGPGASMKVKTSPAFVPDAAAPREELLAEFGKLQAEQIAFVRDADGLPIHRVKIVSPFSDRVRYSLYSALTILPAHQHRHLGQAENALNGRE